MRKRTSNKTLLIGGVIALVTATAAVACDSPTEANPAAAAKPAPTAGVIIMGTAMLVIFATVAAIMVVGTVQTVLTYRGGSLVPNFGGKRPEHVPPTMNGV